MSFFSIRTAAALVAASVLLVPAACQNMVASSGVYYNFGLADASNKLLLANIVRSAKGYPNYYSVVGDYSASSSASASPSVSIDFPIQAFEEANLDASIGPSVSSDRNANVSSLETQDFVRAMHTKISPNLMAFFIESRDAAHIHLVLTLLVRSTVITFKDYDDIILDALDLCSQRFDKLASAQRGICRNFEYALAEITCDPDVFTPKNAREPLVRLLNDPTNRCAYSQFRAFSEALTLSGPRVRQDKNGGLELSFELAEERRPLFGKERTGVVLRSPAGILQYLGEIVRDSFSRDDPWTPSLTTRSGKSAPIFLVKSGSNAGKAAVSVKVDDREYWIQRQDLGAQENDFSYQSLTIIKDFQALNTAQDQLPDSPTIFFGTGTSTR